MTRPSVDVVIATYNRQERVVQTLRSLLGQTHSHFGVIVVDDGSDPPVESALPPEIEGALPLTLLRTPGNRGPAAARNMAVAASHAEVIAFIDDDVDADAGWLAAHLSRLEENSGRAVVVGPLLAPPDWRPTAWNRWEAAKLAAEYRRMEAGLYTPTWRQFFTGNAALRRSLLLDAGGFDETLRRAEDIELGLRLSRLGCHFVFAPEAKGWHYASRTREAWLNNAEHYAAIDAALDARYPDLGWLDMIQHELRGRPPAFRFTRAAAVTLLGGQRATAVAAEVARACNRGALTPLALRAASLAYDIRYRTALSRATAT